MKSFAEKVTEARHTLKISQMELAEMIDVSDRSIKAYEKGEKRPRKAMLYKLAAALQVSVKYLLDEDCDDPKAEIEKDTYVSEAHTKYGAAGARDVDSLLAANSALFAGGDLSDEQKDAFFAAVAAAYAASKEEARKKFGKKDV